MKVLILKNNPKVGMAGEIKEVKSGYAINYLIPAGIVCLATDHNLGLLTRQKNKIEKKNARFKSDKAKVAQKINRKKFSIKASADDSGSLYAQVDKKIISEELKKQGFNVDSGEIMLGEKIKKIGKKKVELKIASKKAIITIEVK